MEDSRLQLGRVRVNTKKCKSTSYDSKKFICSSKSKGKTSKSTLPCAKDSGSGLFCCIGCVSQFYNVQLGRFQIDDCLMAFLANKDA